MAESSGSREDEVMFHSFGLDDRLLKAIAKLGWSQPTLIQSRAIPLALQGKDIVARARTGSGKTAAAAIPILQNVLNQKRLASVQETVALVLAPSRELCKQIYNNYKDLTISCSRDVRVVDVSQESDLTVQRPLLLEKADIVIGTPGRIMAHLRAGNLEVSSSVRYVVIDEADLMFTFGFEEETRSVLSHLPPSYQAFLMSATLSEDVLALKRLVLHSPVILRLEEPDLPPLTQLTHYVLRCEEEDKFVLIYTLLKLKLVRGRSLVFVNAVDRCYRLKLYLEQFGIASCVLNSELPVASRCHIVTQFNDGLYDILVASDERCLDVVKQEDQSNAEGPTKAKRKRHKDKESGVSRGIDFLFISNVINFDFPLDVDTYIHRAGRTARGNNQGTALSFVSESEVPTMENVEKAFLESQFCDADNASFFRPYQFRMEELEGFRYRARDAMRAVTRIAIREARLKEIKTELLASQKLKTYFEDNPRDLQILRHDRALHTVRQQPHLKDVPDYIVPPTLQKLVGVKRHNRKLWKNFKRQNETSRPAAREGSSRGTGSKVKRLSKRQPKDPLKTFSFRGVKKQKNVMV